MLIYQAKNLIYNKCYIGQTIHRFEKRKSCHLSSAKNGFDNYYFYNAIRKYGEDVFKWTILEDNISHINKLNWLEEFYIAYLNTLAPNGYNLESGGKNYIVSEETRKRMSEFALKRPPITIETREKISKANKGRKQNEKEKRKRSKINKGKNGTPCIILGIKYEALSGAADALKTTKFIIQNIINNKKNNDLNYIKNKIIKGRSGIQCSILGIEYKSLKEAAISLKTTKFIIQDIINNKKNNDLNYIKNKINKQQKRKYYSILGIKYKSKNDAAKVLKTTRYFIQKALNDPNNKDYQYIEN